ncbi:MULTISPECIES: Sec-independent protein translocase protein TatB [Shewanella]|jgi:sec-independent protein translocase protein TatB|uniref:Sec-independent protein translocase protein TatB n=1 Tax=Shewanella fodinae TaxID=552357 RepID=A0A4R2F182_9GAMM|nr:MULTISPECIES: Sec-independent protein translocase protein TatB [Shewanella]MBO1271027.1 Sec-independent protein translocase subunit TatB [Shewanella sp. 4t3-1-2LB]MCL2907317.1 Sec-independent protein translocase protein TatB [Shewanella fodinae]TCN77995.1 sec-independent protein translocase protein TatB [Shewanella fodinae]GGY94451.1 Sec-independent protein translocase protein TatB [Shewanella fodinae]
MFDGIGFSELLLIGILGLVVLGPERLPIAVRTISNFIRTMKRMANSVKDELEQELKLEQLHADLKKAESKGLGNLSPELQESINQLKEAAQSVNRPYQIDSDKPAKAVDDSKPAATEVPAETATAEPSSASDTDKK